MTPLSVLVTAVGGGGIGEQLIKALRLAPRPYRIVGTDMSSFSKGFCEVDEAEVVPAAHDPGFLPALLRLSERHEVRAILCGSEAELEVLSAHRQMIEAAGIFLPINPDHVLEICLDKVKTSAFLSANGFATPAYAKISSSAQLAEFHHLPAVIKPSHGSGGSTNVFLAQSIPDLVGFSEHLLAQQLEIVVQEYVGTPENEFTVGVLSGMDGVILNSIAVRRNILTGLSNRLKERNRTTRDDLGPILAISNGISQGDIGPFPEVTASCEEIARRLGARGPLNIQCRLVQGRVYVFEINARFSGTTSLRAMVGYNEPDVLIRRHVLGEDIAPRFPYRSGTIARGLSESLLDPRMASRRID